jgi:hypothetical protein
VLSSPVLPARVLTVACCSECIEHPFLQKFKLRSSSRSTSGGSLVLR